MKFRTKLMLSFFLLCGVPFCVASFLLTYTATQNIQQNTTTYVSLFAQQISSNVDAVISELDRMMKTTFLNADVCEALEGIGADDPARAYTTNTYLTQHIFNLTAQQPDIRCVILVDERDNTFLSGISPVMMDYPAFVRTVRMDEIVRQNGRIVISPAHKPTYLLDQSGSPVFSIGRLIKNSRFQVVGKIVLDIHCADLIRRINVSPALTQNGARIVVTNDAQEIVADTSEAFNPDAAPLVYAPDSNVSARHIAYQTRSAYSGLTVTVIIPTQTLFYSVENFRSYVLMITVALLLCILALGATLSFYIVRPIKRLEHMAGEVQDGNFAVRSGIHAPDEIGSLARSFDMMVEKIQNLVRNVYLAQLHNKQSQLEALQHQINPHFLHNTLESIRMKAVINQDLEVAGMIKSLGRLFRITLDRRSNLVTIRDELSHVATYLEIQNMRYENRFVLLQQVDENLLDCGIIKLILQPIVENSVLHGFGNNHRSGKISMIAQAEPRDIRFTVQDDGDGMSTAAIAEKNRALAGEHSEEPQQEIRKSIGLQNISDRLRLEYGEQYSLILAPAQGGGLSVQFSIPRH